MTDAQANTVCQRVAAAISSSERMAFLAGYCALTFGQIGSADCTQSQATCLANPTDNQFLRDGCGRSDIPACARVTIDEYVTCETALLKSEVELFSRITCSTDVSTLMPLSPPDVCSGPFERCEALATGM